MNQLYADHAATTPVHPQVVQVMTELLTEHFGNASSIHAVGRRSRQFSDEARTSIAQSIGANFNEIIFTSGGTEANYRASLFLMETDGREMPGPRSSWQGGPIFADQRVHHRVVGVQAPA